MTSSFQPGNFNIDTSQYNYAKESPDLASMVNANIDRNKEILDQHYNRLVEMNNAAQKAKEEKWDSIAKITGTAIKLKPFIEDKLAMRRKMDRLRSEKGKAEVEHKIDTPNNFTAYTSDEELEDNQQDMLWDERGSQLLTQATQEYNDPNVTYAQQLYGATRRDQKDFLNREAKEFNTFLEGVAKDNLKLKYGGRWYSYTEAIQDAYLSELWHHEALEAYSARFNNLNISEGMIRKYLLRPLLDEEQTLLGKLHATRTKIAKENSERLKNEHLFTNAESDRVQGIMNWIKYYLPSTELESPGYGMRTLKTYAANAFVEALESKQIGIGEAEALMNEPFLPKGSKKEKTIAEHFPEFSIVNAKIIDMKEKKYDRYKKEGDNSRTEWSIENIPEMQKEVTEASPEDRKDILNKWMIKYHKDITSRFPGLNLPFPGNKFMTLLENIEENRYESAEREFQRTGVLDYDKLSGFTDPELVEKAKKLKEKAELFGLEADEIKDEEARLAAHVREHLQLEVGEANKDSVAFKNVFPEAKEELWKQYESLRRQGQSKEASIIEAMKRATEEEKLKSWNTQYRQGYELDPNAPQAYRQLLSALSSGTSLDSKEPFPGELPHLEQGIAFLASNGQKGELPVIYRDLARNKVIKIRLDDGSTIALNAHELMVRRLKATGFADEKTEAVSPERYNLIPELQELLLNKGTYSSAYRVVLEQEDETAQWMLDILNDPRTQTVEDLRRQYRFLTQHQYTYHSSDINWLRLVDIDPADLEEYNGIVGDMGPYMQLDNLLPGVAKVAVEENLKEKVEEEVPSGHMKMMGGGTFDMSQIGKQTEKTAQETWEDTGIYQGIEFTRKKLLDVATNDDGTLNSFGRVLQRIASGEGFRDVEDAIASAPIGQLLFKLTDYMTTSQIEELMNELNSTK